MTAQAIRDCDARAREREREREMIVIRSYSGERAVVPVFPGERIVDHSVLFSFKYIIFC